VRKDNWIYLIGGVLLGALIGYGVSDFMGRGSESASRAPAIPPPQRPAGAPVAAAPGPSAEELANLERVIQADPKNVTALTHLGNLMYDSGKWAEALGYYRRALDAGPPTADVLTDAGICYRQLRQFDQALDYFRRAQELEPGHWQSLFNTAVVAGHDLGRFDVADAAIGRLEAVNPGAPGLARLRQDLAAARAAKGSGS
jgi:tetratricopeptide (TPR) repeat protein